MTDYNLSKIDQLFVSGLEAHIEMMKATPGEDGVTRQLEAQALLQTFKTLGATLILRVVHEDLGFGQRQHKGVCKSCHHVMLEVDGTFYHNAVAGDGTPYRCEYVRQGRIQFKFGDPEVLPFLRKRDRRSNKRAEKF